MPEHQLQYAPAQQRRSTAWIWTGLAGLGLLVLAVSGSLAGFLLVAPALLIMFISALLMPASAQGTKALQMIGLLSLMAGALALSVGVLSMPWWIHFVFVWPLLFVGGALSLLAVGTRLRRGPHSREWLAVPVAAACIFPIIWLGWASKHLWWVLLW